MSIPALLTRCRAFIAEEHRSTLECATNREDGTVDQDEATQAWLAEAQGLLAELDEAIAHESRPDPLSQALNEGDGAYRP